MRMAAENYEYRALFDRNFDPLAGIDRSTKRFLADQMKIKHGKGWEYAGVAPMSAIATGDIQPQGFCFLFKRTQAQGSLKKKPGKTKK